MMDGLFGGDQTTTSETDLPAWLKPYWEENLKKQQASQNEALAIKEAMKDWRPEGWSLEEDAAMGMLSELPTNISGLENAGVGFLEAGTGALEDMNALTGGINAADILRFMDPYNEAVIGNTIRDMEEQSKRQQLESEARAAAVGGTTGSRQAISDILREQQLARETAAYGDQARSDAFRWATDTARGDRGEAFDRSSGLAENLGRFSELSDKMATTKATRDMGMAEMMAGMGEKKRAGFNARDQWPMELQNWYQGQVGGGVASPAGVSNSQTTAPGEGNVLSTIVGLGTTAAGLGWNPLGG